jgi:hypothetical protein
MKQDVGVLRIVAMVRPVLSKKFIIYQQISPACPILMVK